MVTGRQFQQHPVTVSRALALLMSASLVGAVLWQYQTEGLSTAPPRSSTAMWYIGSADGLMRASGL